MYHCSASYVKENRHTYCPTGADTWCKYQKAKETGEKYADKPGLPVAVRDKILPVFTDLSSDELLSKCLHRKAQNNNEALNAFIWKRLPKDIFVGRNVMEIGICSAVMNFNDGHLGFMKVLTGFSIFGDFTKRFCITRDIKRRNNMETKSSEKEKVARKKRNAKRKEFFDKNKEVEGDTYVSGGF